MRFKYFYFTFLIAFINSALIAVGYADDELDELIVIGSRLDLQPQQLGSAMTILTAEDLANIGTPFVADALRHVPGLAVSRTGPAGGLTQVRVRGSEANHVLVFVDGVEMNPPNGEYDFASLTTANIERIEVLRGAQSGIYGSNATAGVINIVTGAPRENSNLALQVESGSLGFNRQSLGLSAAGERARGSVRLSHQRFAFNAAEAGSEKDLSENYGASMKGDWRFTDTISLFANGYYNSREFDSDDQVGGVAMDSDAAGDNKETAYQLGLNLQAFDNTWINKLHYDHSRFSADGLNGFGRFGDRGSREKLSLQSRWDFDNRGDVQQRLTVFVENEKELYRNTVPTDPSQVPEQSRRLRSAGLEYFTDINQQVYLSAAVRSDNNDNFADASTYHLAGRWLLSDNASLHTSLGTGVTNPSFYEQFGFFPGFYTGNPDLEPEEQQSWDIGWQQTWLGGDLTTDITYFDLTLEKEIAGFTTPINLTTDSERQGVEFSLAWQSASGLLLNSSYTYTDARELDEEELRRPEHTGSLDLSIPFMDRKLRWQLGLVYNGDMVDTDFSTFTRRAVDSYTVVNTSLRYFINEQIEAFVRVNNVFDEEYQEVIGYATPGFYASAGVAITL